MKQSLQLKIGQQLTMTPQLQQAIRLLQLSSLDLQQEIQDALDSNPLLETAEEFEGDTPQESNTSSEDTSAMDTDQAMANEDMPNDLPTDSTWEDTWSAESAPISKGTGSGVASEDDYVYQGETSESLQDYLLWQMRLSHFTELDERIGEMIIDGIDENGYLQQDLEDILAAVQKEFPETEMDEVCVVLKRIQYFDPIGVAARDVGECMCLQLNQLAPETPWLNEAKTVVSEHLQLLANRDYRTLARKTRLKEPELKEVIRLIHTLQPRPGENFTQRESEYVIPDVSVRKHKNRWIVELNPDALPKIRVNEEYAALSKSARNSEDSQYIKNHVQEARWFIKSLESRNETLLKVTNCIVQRQQAFFEYGEEAMKPMVLNDVAESIDMHESTVSRVTTQKFMHTPRGIFELKYFFSSHVGTEDGGECSSTAIRAFIRKLIAAERSEKPLSDSKIAELMADQGIKVARRTIAKYREAMNIPPSNQRKSLL
ncbi:MULTISPECIES: RNA polymerase factor sigma-54 [Gammaproteobacteria]|uniref:RNA polymerase factor sigma-54 n=1 Tax=Gammaproteobacteria TaxID=1236 RepID=UPI000DCFB57E|nr:MULTISPECIES: RNA polymerase factor sigma-54 [Gammaproteobacteria]RTE86352.1 RNA polymerase factor sigma-54 [Aliidiomarina sp. B3213]TCZ91702.1 RNA polymerase factor sigma-54 [Lysobacter sp. N42]